ncbi:hypothetical protein MAPG_04693 [Magnaporthiopsis poae ATCC 64411]|uniref:Uncharacterized protein n=1 Tax=Magnaporthiopsis poae (strain ATCC 64411 / 73-15) TaxID=644358 RepID=A0A0C4DXE6_MAGP6|nr:hypothetical protein MAPG_04693 [Magnaporthiopsis poae ATCC 64411]
MGKHREQGHFDRARWRLALLVPFWILQLLFLLGLMGVFSYRLVATSELLKDEETKAGVSTVKIIWEVLNVGFALISLALCLVEVAKFLTETLTPLVMLISHIVKAVLAVAVLGLDVAVHLKNMEGKYTMIGLGIDGGLLLATFIPTIYSIIVYRRHLKYSDYQHPVNAKSYGFSSPPKISTPPSHSRLELGEAFYTDGFETSYASQTSTMSSSRSRSGSCHKPGGGAVVVANRTRSLLSVRSGRRVSSGGSSILTMLDTGGGNGGRDSPDLAKTRAAAASPLSPYSHERSTEFEEYVKRRSKVSGGGRPGLGGKNDKAAVLGVLLAGSSLLRSEGFSRLSAIAMEPTPQAESPWLPPLLGLERPLGEIYF